MRQHIVGKTTALYAERPAKPSLERRIGEQITPQPSGCWIWRDGADGYGVASDLGESIRVHRFVYETLVGPIPDDHVLHHECENPPCCNPAHLVPMTPGGHTAHHAVLRRKPL